MTVSMDTRPVAGSQRPSPPGRWALRWSRRLARLHGWLGWPGEAVALLDYERCAVRLGVSSAIERHVRLHSCAKEPETVAWIEQSLAAGDVFYDIGANVGAYTLVAAAYWGAAVRTVAIEPSAVNFARLIRNLTLNPCARQVIPLPVALGERTGVELLHMENLVPGGALHTVGEAVHTAGRRFRPVASCATLVFSLDALIAQFGLPPPTHLKLDVDGTELTVLKGAEETLRGVRSLLVEVDERQAQAEPIQAFLQERGFRVEATHPYRYGERYPAYRGIANVIFDRT